MIITRAGGGDTQQVGVIVNGFDDSAQENQELGVCMWVLTRFKQVLPVIGGHGPVVVLAGAIDAGKRLFMEQANKSVAQGDFFHRFHRQLVVVGGDVGGGEDRGQFMLRRCNLVVLGLGGDAELPQLHIQVGHESRNPFLELAEIMVFQFLSLGRLGAEKRPAGQNQVFALVEQLFIDQEILLLRADGGGDTLGRRVAEGAKNPERLAVQGVHRTQQGGLLVECFAGIGGEGGWDAQGTVLNESRRGAVPGGIAAGFEGGAQAAGRERGGIRFSLDKLLAGELHDHAAVGGR